MNFLGPAMGAIKPRVDDSGTDRLNYYYSSMMIIICSVTITARQYVGSPLQCWVPAQFTKSWEQYAENYCFVYNTYWVKPDQEVPESIVERDNQQLIYYQWVPFIMALEAAFFYFPAMFWGQMSSKSGLNVENIVKTAQEADSETDENRKKKVNIIVSHIDDSIKLKNVRSKGKGILMRFLKFGLLDGSYISNVYILTKCLYFLNLIGQFWMMNKFLGQNDPYWGAKIFTDIMHGTDWELSGNFPRIAMCDFTVRVLGNMQRYSIQCVLSLNMFNEKIFLFLYWWFIVVGIFTFLDLIDLIRATRDHEAKKLEFLKKYVKFEETNDFSDFCKTSMTSDVIVLLKFISTHSTDVMTTDIIERMYSQYKEKRILNTEIKEIEEEKSSNSSSRETTPLMSSPKTFV